MLQFSFLDRGEFSLCQGLDWIIVTVPAREGRESFLCLIIRLDNCCRFTFWRRESFPSARIRLDSVTGFSLGIGEGFPCAMIRLDNCYWFPSWKWRVSPLPWLG